MTTARASSSAQREKRSDAHRNRERLAAAAVAAVRREGLAVPMATIAADAGVGVATLYRHFPTREDLLDELTYRSFERMLAHLVNAGAAAATATQALRTFWIAVIRDRNDMLLPSTGGPAPLADRTKAVQRALHDEIRRVLARGAADGTIRREVGVWDIAWLGSALAQPGREGGSWDAIALRLLDAYLTGLGVP